MTDVERYDSERVGELLSGPRLAPYLRSADGNLQDALTLYGWGTRVSAGCFEVVGHLEVLLRNSLDTQLRLHLREEQRGLPWFLLPLVTGGHEHVDTMVDEVRRRLRPQGKETRDQIIAGLGFGFWSGLLGPKYEQLWRDCLHRAFPNASGRRKDIATAVEGVRKFRNRLAHHDSMINVDIPFEIRRVIELAGSIDSDAALWLSHCSQAMDLYATKPVDTEDTAVVAAREAWPLYQACGAYVCQAGRSFRPVARIAFYADQEIKTEVPYIVHRRDNVDWSAESMRRLCSSPDKTDRKIGAVIRTSHEREWNEGLNQVFILTTCGHPQHRSLSKPLPHTTNGRGSAFTQRQRYVSLHQLEIAKSTQDLV